MEDAELSVTDVRENVVSSPASVERPKRRNGKPQSCEPCRKAKVSCDHSFPICSRCTRKGIPGECVYHPAPLTRTSISGENEAGARKRRKLSTPSVDATTGAAASNLLLLLSQQKVAPQNLVEGDHLSEPSDEYLGPTNYAAIFRETNTQIGADLWRREADGQHRASTGRPSSLPLLSIGVEVLSKFPDEATSNLLMAHFQRSSDICMSLHDPTIIFAHKDFWSRWGSHMKARNFRPVAEKLLGTPPVCMRACKNSADWVRSFTGENMRFEMIGVLLSLMSLTATTLPVWDSLFDIQKNGRIGKKHFSERLGDAAEACFDICNDLAMANEPLIWLMSSVQVTQSQYRGDDEGTLWPKSGIVCSAICTYGLHRDRFIDTAPFMVAELRRRTFGEAYITDKQMSTFTGRPPRLSKRFCSTQLPRDLNDEEIMYEGEELEKALSSLDSNGWNTDGQLRGVSVMRMFILSSQMRDEILELCLGPSSEISKARKDELVKRAEAAYLALPSHFHLPDDDEIIMASSPERLCVQLMSRLEYLINVFLILRTPGQEKRLESADDLISVSLKLLECMARVQEYREKLTGLCFGQGWWTVYYGIPAASILSVELLKQHQYPARYRSSLPRPRAIRLLSIYALALSVIGPEEGNHKICVRMHKVVSRILDQVLEPLPAPFIDGSSSMPTPASSLLPDIDLAAVMGPNDDPDFMDWLHTVDWNKAPWMDSIGML